jgi:hypothetical protein
VGLHLPDSSPQGIRAAMPVDEAELAAFYRIVDVVWLLGASNLCSKAAAITEAVSNIATNLALNSLMTGCW